MVISMYSCPNIEQLPMNHAGQVVRVGIKSNGCEKVGLEARRDPHICGQRQCLDGVEQSRCV